MDRVQDKALSRLIIRTMKKLPPPVYPSDLQDALRKSDFPESTRRVTVLQMLEQGDLELTPDRCLVLKEF